MSMSTGAETVNIEEMAIDKRKLSDQVSILIQQKIIKNELKSGERLVETKIAKELGISQTPVREAIRELESMGFVESRPYMGCFVRTITRKDLSQAYHLRSMLESFAVSEAEQMGNKVDVDRLLDMQNKMLKAANEKDRDLFSVYDVEFHKIIVMTAQNPLLEKMWHMASTLQWTRLTITSTEHAVDFFIPLHDAIIKSLSKDEYKRAQQEIERHFSLALDLVEIGLLKSGDKKKIGMEGE